MLFRSEDAAMLEKPADNGAHGYMLADAFHTWHQGADATHNQVDFHACLGCFVQPLNDLIIEQGIHLD